ncbi:MAG: DHA2 family efflux MFS transporter permease subunit [Proteobacteria bacterium]|jgi:DHA2 family multidrug resistance protein|nr:DHA2 family efflux MFS transporter permease subunit [Pseudomonadota bacterium]
MPAPGTALHDAPPPLSGGMLALGTIALSLATFMNVLDTSIANVSIPAIAGDLAVSPDQGTWVITSFAVANAISLPLTGWLTQRFGQVRLFLASVLLFVTASFLCGLATSLPELIVFRVIQGAVAGPMIPLSQALLLSSYPKERSGSALAMWSITTLVAPVVGPLLGGWITDNISWPWIFYINIPVGLAAAAVTWLIYRSRETPTTKVPVDVVGLGLLILWVGSLQVMLDKGKDLDWFGSTFIAALAIVATIGFAAFLVWELTDRHPIVDLRLFGRRNFWTSTLSIALGYATFFGNVVLLPLWLQQFMGYTATMSGFILAPVGILAILMMPAVGRNLHRVDPRIFSTASFAIFALVLVMRSHFTTGADIRTLMIPTIIQGASVALFFVPLVALSLSGLHPSRIPAASGLFNFARIVAGSFGTSITTTVWDHRASFHHAQLASGISPYDLASQHAFTAMQGAGMSAAQAGAAINRMIDEQAYMLSANDIFHASALICVALIAVVWLARPVKSTRAAPVIAVE